MDAVRLPDSMRASGATDGSALAIAAVARLLEIVGLSDRFDRAEDR
jgi:hypothetical protein